MQYRKTESGFHVVIDKDEKVMESLSQLVRENQIPSGTISGLGALKNAKLGFYHLHEKRYDEKYFTDEMELLSLVGNITWLHDKPVVHCHVTLGDTEFKALGGHLFEADVAVTCEVFINVKPEKIERAFVPGIGLNLQNLGCA